MADLKHSVAICTDDNRRIGIEEVYTLSPDGKQINIPGVVEAIRKLGKENKLECECGCGGKLMLKAGEAMIMTQHFAMKPGQGISDCRSTSETDYTRLCKGMLKCWLDTVFSLEVGEIQYAYPYSKIEEGERRYEFTFYVPKRKFGLIFGKASFIDADKLSYFADKDSVKFLAVSPESNFNDKGQYPEYEMRMQNTQGFCVYINASEDFSECTLSIVRYELTYKRVWHSIVVLLDAPLSHFSISPDGELVYEDELVKNMVNEHVASFKDYDNFCAERAKEVADERKIREDERKREAEQKRLEYEYKWEKFKKEKEERERLRAEREAESKKRRELANQKRLADEEAEKVRIQKLIKSGEEYLADYPAKKAIYDVVRRSYRIEGTFLLLRSNGTYSQGRVWIVPSAVWYDAGNNNIVLKDVAGKVYLIHLQHYAGDRPKLSPMPDGGYCYFAYFARKYDPVDAVNMFTSFFNCLGGGTITIDKEEYGCKLKDVNPELSCCDYEKGICKKPDSACSYRIIARK